MALGVIPTYCIELIHSPTGKTRPVRGRNRTGVWLNCAQLVGLHAFSVDMDTDFAMASRK